MDENEKQQSKKRPRKEGNEFSKIVNCESFKNGEPSHKNFKINFSDSKNSYDKPSFSISEKEAKLWVELLSQRLAVTLPAISIINECTLYPFVFDTLSHVILLSHTAMEVESVYKYALNIDDKDLDEEEEIIEDVMLDSGAKMIFLNNI